MVAALTRLFGVHNLALRTARTYTPELGRQLESEWALAPTVAEAFGESATRDDQLRMMFEHSGSWQGFEAHIARYVDDRVTIVVLMNLGGANPTRIAHGVAGLYRRGLSTPANTAGF